MWGWKFQNATPPTVFIRSEPNLIINKAVIRECKNYVKLNIKDCKILWQFKILTWKSMESPKKCNIVKIADHPAKQVP